MVSGNVTRKTIERRFWTRRRTLARALWARLEGKTRGKMVAILCISIVLTLLLPAQTGQLRAVRGQIQEKTRISYEGFKRDTLAGPFELLSGQSISISIATPPSVGSDLNAWRLWYSVIDLSGVYVNGSRPTIEQLTANLIPGGMNLYSYTLNLAGSVTKASYLNAANVMPGQQATFGNPSESGVKITIGRIVCTHYYRLWPEDQSNVVVTETGPDTRRVDVTLTNLSRFDPGFGTSAAFFNGRFGYRLQYYGLGRCSPLELTTPNGTSTLETFRVKSGCSRRLFVFQSTQTRLFLSARGLTGGFHELGFAVEGTWRHHLRIVDSSHPVEADSIPPAQKVSALLLNDLELVRNLDLTLGPGQSYTLPNAPDLRARNWYKFQGYIYLESIAGPIGSLNVSDAAHAFSPWYLEVGKDSIWFAYGDNPTLKNVDPIQTITVKLTYTVEYRADATKISSVLVSDTATDLGNGYVRHNVLLTLPRDVPDSDLGFSKNAGFRVGWRTFDWQIENFKTPSGDSVDNPRFRGSYQQYINSPYKENGTIAPYYYERTVTSYYMYALGTVSPEGTWRLTVLEPVLSLQYTKTGGDLLVTDPQGRRVGFNGADKINTIPGATYYKDSSGVETIKIPEPIQGQYYLEAVAFSDKITVDIRAIQAAQTVWSQQVTIPTQTGAATALSTVFKIQDGQPLAPTQQKQLDYTLTWLPPMTVKDWFKVNQTIPIKFDTRAKDGSFIHDETVKIRVYGPSAYFKEFKFSATPSDTTIRILDIEKTYIVNWHLADITVVGSYAIRVYFKDILLSQTAISIRA